MKSTVFQRNREAAQRKAPEKGTSERCVPTVGIKALEGDGNERKFELSFSSEEPYSRWFGAEILSHEEKAVNLKRLNDIGVLLFNHNTDKVLGRIERAWLEDKRGKAVVAFDDDEKSEEIYQKVKSGTLKGVSVRYAVNSWEEVKSGKSSADGFTGPCWIARSWEPLEVSVVSVPADPTVGVGREYEETHTPDLLSAFEKQIEANKNYLRRDEN